MRWVPGTPALMLPFPTIFLRHANSNRIYYQKIHVLKYFCKVIWSVSCLRHIPDDVAEEESGVDLIRRGVERVGAVERQRHNGHNAVINHLVLQSPCHPRHGGWVLFTVQMNTEMKLESPAHLSQSTLYTVCPNININTSVLPEVWMIFSGHWFWSSNFFYQNCELSSNVANNTRIENSSSQPASFSIVRLWQIEIEQNFDFHFHFSNQNISRETSKIEKFNWKD